MEKGPLEKKLLNNLLMVWNKSLGYRVSTPILYLLSSRSNSQPRDWLS